MREAMSNHAPHRPRPAVTLAVCGAALAAGTAAVLTLFPAPAAPHAGTLHGTAAAVRSPAAGVVVRWLAEPGAVVTPDTPLAEFADAARAADLAAAEAAVADAAAKLAEARRDAELDLAWRTAQLNRDLHAVRAEAADLLRERYDLDLRTVGGPPVRTVSLGAGLANTARTASAAAANVREVLTARLELCDVRESDLTALLAALPAKVNAAAGVPGLESSLAAATAARDAAAARPAAVTVPAGLHGTLGRFPLAAGEPVKPGAKLATVRDGHRPFARVHVPTPELARFPVGSAVTVAFGEGDRRKGYAGEVVSVAPEAAGGVAAVRIEPTGPLWPALPEASACFVTAED